MFDFPNVWESNAKPLAIYAAHSTEVINPVRACGGPEAAAGGGAHADDGGHPAEAAAVHGAEAEARGADLAGEAEAAADAGPGRQGEGEPAAPEVWTMRLL